MKQPRRLAAWLAAFLIAASLVAMPREGAAGPPFIDSLPPVVNEGDPDVPGTSAHVVVTGRPMLAGRFLIARVGQLPMIFFVPREFPRTHLRLERRTGR